ncbi:MAG: [FeFe] hydrogenase H-cluster radical SAM maturase HydE [Candidatus Saganbacteria bacterium]|nr:[FeFe] hydrogenase H-cluster radical SAM maturase HydE [Candidatus Saganbacteria bacterium]
MCYAIPGKVVEINDKKVTVDYFGEHKYAVNEFMGLKVGDYIYAQGGFVINRISEAEALPVLEAWKELFFTLKAVDNRLVRAKTSTDKIDPAFLKLMDKASEEKTLSREELLTLLETEDRDEQALLYKTANFIRQKHLSNSCCIHGIIEFSNYCTNDCNYCGIRKSNQTISRYRMSEEEILQTIDHAVNILGFKALLLQSGEDPEYPVERLQKLVTEIKKRFHVLLFVSVGELVKDGYRRLWEAGARGVLLRFETSNPILYNNCHPNQLLSSRIDEIKNCLDIGYLIVTGGLVGLPGQESEDVLEDIFTAKMLKAEMYSFGPFLPHPQTTFSKFPPSKLETMLNTIAVARIVDPEAKILVTTALETLGKEEGRKQALMAGANSLMLNLTPPKYRKLYTIYPERFGEEKPIEKQIEETLEVLYSIGRAPTDIGKS